MHAAHHIMFVQDQKILAICEVNIDIDCLLLHQTAVCRL